ncbi:DUF1097 domain-containing protein [Clostridium vitabionis]|uniref:DUF1097 domain-containing protein n=1 Tax=Clostridium vitabionis TaxID=2784388 RepID=UPI00188C5156|nr:DUF1097 domain-containing protein [Clostridium vitabionis]
MSSKAILWFSVWTSFFSALLYIIYNFLPFGIGWIMFVCLAIYFGMGLEPKETPGLLLSSWCGILWALVDFWIISLLMKAGLGAVAATFLSVVAGTTVTMCIHLGPLSGTPLKYMPAIFGGVCLTFSQNGGNLPALAATFFFGYLLCAICGWGMNYFMKKYPAS